MARPAPSATGSPVMRTAFVYVRIPTGTPQDDEFHRREDRIDEALKARRTGTVIGWGDSLDDPRAAGRRRVAYHRIDIEVADLAVARTQLHELLPALGAPVGTEIHYDLGGRALQDLYADAGWQLEVAVRPAMPGGVRGR